jgi:4-aminobutyrate--pyruvate transaminase
VQGAGGAITPPATYWDKIQAVLRKYDVLLVADEVICGFGRTGNVWGCLTYGIKPDMLSCAKAMSASYQPISALMVNEKIYQAMLGESKKIGSFAHGYTYAAHPVPCAVAIETLKIYEERKTFDHVREVSPVMQTGLKSTEDHPLVGNARGVGLIAGVELMADKKTRIPFPVEAKAGALVERKCLEAGLVVRALGDRIAFSPPLIMTEENLREMVTLFRKGLDAAYPQLKGYLVA